MFVLKVKTGGKSERKEIISVIKYCSSGHYGYKYICEQKSKARP